MGRNKEKYVLLLNDVLIIAKVITKFKFEFESLILLCDMSIQPQRILSINNLPIL